MMTAVDRDIGKEFVSQLDRFYLRWYGNTQALVDDTVGGFKIGVGLR